MQLLIHSTDYDECKQAIHIPKIPETFPAGTIYRNTPLTTTSASKQTTHQKFLEHFLQVPFIGPLTEIIITR